jgi:hypothetical protein
MCAITARLAVASRIVPLFAFPFTTILPRDSPDCAATRDQGVDAYQFVA